MAIVFSLMALSVMAAFAALVTLTASTEALVADNHRRVRQGILAAGAALDLALDDLGGIGDWTPVLEGTLRSSLNDGPPGPRTLPDGTGLDLRQEVNLANCGRVTSCSAVDLVRVTPERPWGANNPVWILFAYGRLADHLGLPDSSPEYVIVLVADDPAEEDGDPWRDGVGTGGAGVLEVRAEAYGPRGARQRVEATIARGGGGPPGRVRSWRLPP